MPATLSVSLSAHELQEAMRNARPIDAARLDRVLRLEAGHGVVEVQANTTWRSLAARLRPGNAQAAALRTTMPTVGESLARNAAGPDGRPTVMHVEGLTLVTPDGELRRISRRAHPELFALSVGGQGLFGALYSVTLKLDSLARAISEAVPNVSGKGTAPACSYCCRRSTRRPSLPTPGRASRSGEFPWRTPRFAMSCRKTNLPAVGAPRIRRDQLAGPRAEHHRGCGANDAAAPQLIDARSRTAAGFRSPARPRRLAPRPRPAIRSSRHFSRRSACSTRLSAS